MQRTITLIPTIDDVDVEGDEAVSEHASPTQTPGTVMTGGEKVSVAGFPVNSFGSHLFLPRDHPFEHLDTILCLLSVLEYIIKLSLGREFHAIMIIR